MRISSFAVMALAMLSVSAYAQVHLRNGYVTKNGTYVAPSYATNPNTTRTDNYSSQGNVNPYTGRAGTVDPYRQPADRAPQQRCGTNRNGQFICN